MATNTIFNQVLCKILLMIIPVFSNTLSHGKLGSFADLSGKADRRTDVIIYNDKQIETFISINDRDSYDPQFKSYQNITTDYDIKSISIGDKNHDGIADLFVLTETNQNQYQLEIYQDSENFNDDFEKLNMNIQLSDPNILVIDGNGDFTPDILGTQQGTLGFFFLNKDSNQATFVSLGLQSDNITMESISFIDLDQDCRADLVYITNQGQLRMIKGSNFANLELTQSLTSESLGIKLMEYQKRQMFFADINKDGAIDIIVPGKHNNEIYIWTQQNNLNFKKICNDNNGITIKWKDNKQKMLKLTMSTDGGDYNLTESSIIIVGDINMDSNINFIAILENNNRVQKVFVSKLTDSQSDGDKITNIDEISYKFDNLIERKRKRITDIAFFHSGEFPLGLHFLVQFQDNSFEWINLKDSLKNKNYGFLSVLPLNDAPTDSVKRYGGTMSGAMIKAFYRARNGKSIFLTSSTLYQSNLINHLLPFIFLGLGEPESYIEKLVISYSMYDVEEYTFSQPGVPPNSELVLYAHPRNHKPSWRLETFLAPYLTPQTLAIIITITMSILGGFWLYLEIKEKKEITDEKLKAGSATTNNFFF